MVVVVSGVSVWCNITVCTHKILAGGGGLFGQVKSVIKKFFYSGVTLQVAPIKFWPGGGLFGQVKSVIKKIFLLRCNVTGCTHKILVWGGVCLFGQVKSVIKKFFLLRCNITGCTHKILVGGGLVKSNL